jgi:hypothetical protein
VRPVAGSEIDSEAELVLEDLSPSQLALVGAS